MSAVLPKLTDLVVRNGSLVARGKREKYHRVPAEDRTWNGVQYDSKREMVIAQSFDLLLKNGVVTRVDRQVPFRLIVNGKLICTYFADFRLTYPDDSTEIVEVKGVETPAFKLKMKLMNALFPKTNVRIVR